MDWEARLQTIALQENAKLTLTEDEVKLTSGTIFYCKANFSLEHKGHTVFLELNLRNGASGKAYCEIGGLHPKYSFDFSCESHLRSLFGLQRYKLKTESDEIKSFFEKGKGIKKIKTIADKTRFQPVITIVADAMVMEFNLDIENKEQVIEPILTFYKEFIDRFVL